MGFGRRWCLFGQKNQNKTTTVRSTLLQHILTCHCGGVELSLNMPEGLENLRRCNCSMCSRRNAVVASVVLDDLVVTKGQDILSTYSFNTHTAKHYFCSVCGIYTHHQRRSNPHEYGVNISCIAGIEIENFQHIGYLDGRSAHPADKEP